VKSGVVGVSKEVTVLFCDIRNFTQFSETHSLEDVAELIHQYFGVISEIVKSNHGIVHKFMGDGLMAIWGADNSSAINNLNALNACLDIRSAIGILNSLRIQQQLQPIQLGMGVHSGPAFCGVIGSRSHNENTVIGNSVNLASRIESTTKLFGVDILISETMYKTLCDQFVFEEAGIVDLRGISEKVRLFKVSGTIDHHTANSQADTGYRQPTKTPREQLQTEVK